MFELVCQWMNENIGDGIAVTAIQHFIADATR